MGGLKFKIKPEHAVYSIMGMPGIIFRYFKMIQFIVIIILLFYIV